MKNLKLTSLLAGGMFLLLGNLSYGQYVDTGTTIQSGSIVVGSGPALGALVSGDGTLSPTGFDHLTFNPGSIAIGSGTDTITFNTPGNVIVVNGVVNADLGYNAFTFTTGSQTITNSGTIVGGSGTDAGGTGGYGVYISTPGAITNVTINNSGLISGGMGGLDGATGGGGQDAIYIYSDTGDMTGISITNTGSILGGAGANSGGDEYYSGAGGTAIYIDAGDGGLDNVTLKNSGTIAGGSSPDSTYAGYNGGDAVDLFGEEGINALNIHNSGSILGGNAGAVSGIYGSYNGTAGSALYVDAGGDNLSNVTFTNTGNVIGGSSGSIFSSGDDYYESSGKGGFGAYFYSDLTVSNFTLNNAGIIAGGSTGDVTGYYAVVSGSAGTGLLIQSDGSGGITSLVLDNSGSILGGDSGSVTSYYPDGSYYYDGTAGYGIYVYAEDGNIANATLNNSGLIAGGTTGFITGSTSYYEESLPGGAGAQFQAAESISNFTASNSGTIRGGNSGGQAGYYSYYTEAGGDALDVWAIDGNLSGVTINNSGLLAGGNSGNITGADYYLYSGYGGEGIYLYADDGISNVTINNTGSIVAGNSGTVSGAYAYYSYGAGYALYIEAVDGGISNVTVNNSGSILGGNGGPLSTYYGDGYYAYSEDGGSAVYVSSGSSTVSGFTLNNSGMIAGGNSGALTGTYSYVYSGTGGYGVYVYAYDGVSNVSLANSGTIRGGNSGNVDGAYAYVTYDGGDAVHVVSDDSTLSNFSLSNSGLIQGGNSGSTDATDYYTYSYAGGNGLYAYAYNGISGFSLNNSGTIAGGNSGNQYGYGAYYAYAGGNGVEIYSDDSNISNLSMNNSGLIVGGSGGSMINSPSQATYEVDVYGGDGGTGIYLDADETISNASLTNSGRILGGSGGSVSGTGAYEGGNGGTGLSIEATAVNGLIVTNQSGATIQGGNGGNNAQAYNTAGAGGDGLYFDASSSSNVVFNNTGVIAGGNGGTGGGSQAGAGYGLVAYGSGLTINNWGAISVGAGAPTGAIYLDGANNTVNLNGHSSVNGLITATSLSNNMLNIDFTGMSPAAQAALKAQLIAQGDLNNFTGTFTVRGVTYNVDPMVIHLNLSSYQTQGITPNQSAIGANLDSLTYNPAPGTPFFNLLNAIDQSGNVPGALQALSPQAFQIYGDLAIANSTFLVQSVDARLNNLRGGSESIDTSGMGGDTVAGLTKDDDGKSSKEIQPAAPAPNHWGFFATGDGLFFRDSGKADTAGTLAGVDAKVGDHAVVGALFAYDNSAVTLGGNSGNATIQSYTGGLYGTWHDDGFYANSLAVFTRNDYKSERNIPIPGFPSTENGTTDGNQYTANIDGGYDWNATSRITLGPTLGLQYVHLDQFGFNETGGAGALSLSGEDMNSLQTRLGLHADYHLLTGKFSSGALDFHAAWQHEYLNDSRSIGATFEGTGLAPFSVQSASPKRDAAVVGAGVNFTFHNRLTLFTEYELEFWSSSTFEQTINGGARISF